MQVDLFNFDLILVELKTIFTDCILVWKQYSLKKYIVRLIKIDQIHRHDIRTAPPLFFPLFYEILILYMTPHIIRFPYN